MRNALQEYCQKRAWPLPEYTSVNSGPPHNPRFHCAVTLRDNRGRQVTFEGRMQFGKKKDAEQDAAAVAYQQISAAADIFSAGNQQRGSAPAAAPPKAVTPPPLPTAMPVFQTVNVSPAKPSDDDIAIEKMMNYKNQLQEYCVKHRLTFPEFQTSSLGQPHLPRWRCVVVVSGRQFSSRIETASKKEAEQDAAKIALHALGDNLSATTVSYKNLVSEMCIKMGLQQPIYAAIEQRSPVRFQGRVILEGSHEVHTPEWYSSKKQADQEAAKLLLDFLKERKPAPQVPHLIPQQLLKGKRQAVVRSEPNQQWNLPPPHTRTAPRRYQLELYEVVMKSKKNFLVYLPTGTGKTLVACLIIQRMLTLNPSRKALFIVPRVPLVAQQRRVIEEETKLRVVGHSGATFSHRQQDLRSLEENQVLVLTSGLLLNLIERNTISIEDFCVVVLDEAHHTTKRHPYNSFMQKLHSMPNRAVDAPKVIALTATPAGAERLDKTLKQLLDLTANTGCGIIAPVKYKEELEDLVFVPRLEILPPVELSEDVVRFQSDLKKSLGEAPEDNFDLESSFHSAIEIALSKVYAAAEDLGLKYALEQLRHVQEKHPDPRIQNLLLSYAKPPPTDKMPKYQRLVDILQRNLSPHSKALLFVRTKRTARILHELLNREDLLRNILRVGLVLGQTNVDSAKGMSLSRQGAEIKSFRDDNSSLSSCNLLVTTSVLEEGIDVPSCDLLIRYDAPNSLVALMQSRGRARFRNSKFIAIVADHEDKLTYEQLRQCEENLSLCVPMLSDPHKLGPFMHKYGVSPILVLNERLSRCNLAATVSFEKEGPDNAPLFRAFLVIAGLPPQMGVGGTKQEAHNNAAARALTQLTFLSGAKVEPPPVD